MTIFLQLRSANSGAPFIGANQNDTVLWDATERAWFVGPGGGAGAVASVFGRVGAVVAATGDYDGDQVDNVSTVPGASLSDALDYLLANAGAVASVFGRLGAVVAATGDYDSDQVDNVSGVTGASVSDSLEYLQESSTKFATGANLTDADQTLVTSERYVMPAGTTTATRTKTLTPSGTAALGFQLEIGTQGHDVVIQNGGPGGTSGQGSFTVTAGQRRAVLFISDGTDVVVTGAMPLALEPQA